MSCVCLCLLECWLQTALRRRDAATRSALLQRYCRRVSSAIGVQTFVEGPIPTHGLVAANHLSYLDVLVFGTAMRCAFVSKREVRRWPLIGWIASMTGTVFVDRTRPRHMHRICPEMQEKLEAGECLVLFPEATSSDGVAMLPFHSSLFEPAVAASAPITAAHISYEFLEGDGDPRTDVHYWGEMTLAPHLFKLLMKSRLRATVRFAEKPQVFISRKQAAFELRRQVMELADGNVKGALVSRV